ncbi:hypothetical protein F4809DRAFT_657802 [Biscogniauxia mediterranea]|nr:hypothetical protein F4809DRAFT_657802 [Biscogniauxia mediterranea]
MDPSGPSQPPTSASYTTTPDNPVTCTPAEREQQQYHHHHGGSSNNKQTEDRLPPPPSSNGLNISDATPSSLGYGIRGGEQAGLGGRRHSDPDDEKMRAPAEGAVADAVARKPGAAGGAGPDMAGDLERKKREQAAAREAVKEDRRHGGVADGGDLRAGVDT